MGKTRRRTNLAFPGLTPKQFNQYIEKQPNYPNVCVIPDGMFGFKQFRVTNKFPVLKKIRSSKRIKWKKVKKSAGLDTYKRKVYHPLKGKKIQQLKLEMSASSDVIIPFGIEFNFPGLSPDVGGKGGKLYDHSTCFHFNTKTKNLDFWDIQMNHKKTAAFKRFQIVKPTLVPILKQTYGLDIKQITPRFIQVKEQWG